MPILSLRSLALVFVVVSSVADASSIDDTSGARARLAARLAADTAAANEALLDEAREHIAFCVRCHGEDGNSVMPLVPNLAGQNAYYLLEQIERFASGRRKDFIMTPLSRQFSPDGAAAVALYFARQRPRPYAADAGLQARGRALFHERCTGCHGADARGGERYARLAGQRPEYLRHRLHEFQTQMPTEGTGTVMLGIARGLSDADVEALAAYLASLP